MKIKTKLENVNASEMLSSGWQWYGTMKPESLDYWVNKMERLNYSKWFVSPLMDDVVECWAKH